MRVLGVIPARAGSKGVKDKNIRKVCGKPLICYAIEAAKASKKLYASIVTSDSIKILDKAFETGISIWTRPAELATDTASVVDVAIDVLTNRYPADLFDAVMLLQPTSPYRTGADIDNAIELLEAHNERTEGGEYEYSSLISVVKCEDDHPARCYGITDDALWGFLPGLEKFRRQDLPPAYRRNGCIYLVRRDDLISHHSFMVSKRLPYIMPRASLVNIDTEEDLAIAEVMMKGWKP